MKSFQQPSIKDSLASQGMTLRGCTVRAGQGDMKEETYMVLIGSDNENKTRKNPQPPPEGRENTPLPPPHPAPKPLIKDPKNPLPSFLSDSTEMSTDEYKKVSTQLKQVARSLNRNEQHPVDVPSTDSEVFLSLIKARSEEGTGQVHNTDIASGDKLPKQREGSEARDLKRAEIRQ